MKDLMGTELQDGDIIVDIRTNYAWCNVGVLAGGQTAGGSIRYLNSRLYKKNTLSKHLLKITPQLAQEFLERKYSNEDWVNDFPAEVQNFIDTVITPRL